ncbi:hypothetical protein V6N11_018735 [Hibiscus sabdariffa]|uniref:Uncharacterized protein n=1 Tax=Hibiscus sabdariffa TaxID=183260 RepID=A0ABR2QT62_9ROSI
MHDVLHHSQAWAIQFVMATTGMCSIGGVFQVFDGAWISSFDPVISRHTRPPSVKTRKEMVMDGMGDGEGLMILCESGIKGQLGKGEGVAVAGAGAGAW